MPELRAILEQKPSKRRMHTQDQRSVLSQNGESLKQFPLPMYFQTHFQVMHERVEANQKELAQIKRQLTHIENLLNRLLGAFEISNPSSSSH